MKRICLLIFSLCLSIVAFGQSEISVDLEQWKGKKQSIPFKIVEIQDNRIKTEVLGKIKIAKNRDKTIRLARPAEQIFENFMRKNYSQGRELDIRMEIERIEIKEVELKKNKKMPALYFACKFYKNDNSMAEPLYSFTARNTIPKKNALKLALTNYLGRATTAAIANFKKSYQKHPEWLKANINTPTVKIDKSIYYNQFEGGDTIAIDGKHNLTLADFAGVVAENEKDDAYSSLTLSYALVAEDSKKKIKVAIYPKLYFLRSRSWAKKDSKTNWLAHQQLLFDLASYHGLQFKKALQAKTLSAGYYKAEINKIYNAISADYNNEMDQLQAETQYGTNAAKETEWKSKVDNYLGR